MKRIVLCFMFVFFGIINHVFAAGKMDVKTNPPKEGTPEYIAVEYTKALYAGDKEKVLSFCDEEMKKYFAYKPMWDDAMERQKNIDLNKTFKYLNTDGNEAKRYVIQIYYFDKKLNKDKNRQVDIIKKDDKYVVTIGG